MHLKYFTFISLLFCFAVTFSQTNDSVIGYKGGIKMLARDILKRLPTIFYKNAGPESLDITCNRYYNVVMKIQKDGTIDKSILVFSVMDTVKVPFIINAIQQTNGNWINNSGEDQLIVLPLYLLYERSDESQTPEKIPIMRQDYYLNWTKSRLIYFEPIVSTAYSPVH